ncbi:MAG TPA: hypothetical protein ENH62_00550 [Marinobacter sp.]|nr:hypothetical protein [Marinobacter sp.]
MLKDLPIDPTTGKPITTGVWPPREPNPQSSTTPPEAQSTERVEVSSSPAPPPDNGEPMGGPSYIPMIVQAHGGALKSRGTPGNAGGRGSAQSQARRKERLQEINAALLGSAEKLTAIIDGVVEQAGGKQYRCSCGLFGPKVPRLSLREATDAAAVLMRAARDQSEVALSMIQINVVAGVQVVPNQPLGALESPDA